MNESNAILRAIRVWMAMATQREQAARTGDSADFVNEVQAFSDSDLHLDEKWVEIRHLDFPLHQWPAAGWIAARLKPKE